MTRLRVHHTGPLTTGDNITLSPEAAHHALSVMRLKIGDPVFVFNGEQEADFQGEIILIKKNEIQIKLLQSEIKRTESPLKVYLGQSLLRSEKMDFVVQKCTELGVASITPIETQYVNVKFDATRINNKMKHWEAVAESAACQSGRHKLPAISAPVPFDTWIKMTGAEVKLILEPLSKTSLNDIATEAPASIAVLIGPEGGFSSEEIAKAKSHGFIDVKFGPRILRTETAGVSFLSIAQFIWGDLN